MCHAARGLGPGSKQAAGGRATSQIVQSSDQQLVSGADLRGSISGEFRVDLWAVWVRGSAGLARTSRRTWNVPAATFGGARRRA